MKMRFILLCMLTLLCHCATKHQPSSFEPYFARGPERFDWKLKSEKAELFARQSLSIYEKKRLLDLMRKESTERKATNPLLLQKIDALVSETQDLESEVAGLQLEWIRENAQPQKGNEIFENPRIKKYYQETQKLWNDDKHELALQKLDRLPVKWWEEIRHSERLAIAGLRFRVRMETSDFESAFASYSILKSLDDCAPETAQAGFLMALLAFGRGDVSRALAIFESQCDQDTSPVNLAKRSYWAARLKEANWELASKTFHELGEARLPGYYQFLSQARLREAFHVPMPASIKPLWSGEFKVGTMAKSLFEKAERCLEANLRREATLYLLHSIRYVSEEDKDNIAPMLYLASLFKAAGEHLEAMKVYNTVNTWLERIPSEVSPADLFREMYPRPFTQGVDWHSRIWKVDPDFVYSIMRQESAFNPRAVSKIDARGLMQLMPFLGRSLSRQWGYSPYFREKGLLTAEENIRLAVFHLHQLNTLAAHPFLVAAAYNAGFERVTRWRKRFGHFPADLFTELIPIAETRNYVKLVFRNYIYYKALNISSVVPKGVLSWELPQLAKIPAGESKAPGWSGLERGGN